MTFIEILVLIVMGALVGWLADLVPPRDNLSLFPKIVLGVVSLLAGPYVLGWLGVALSGFVWEIVTGVIIACVILFVLGLLTPKSTS